MIDHGTRMLAVELQGLISNYQGQLILPKMNEIIVRLGGQEMSDHWPSTLQVCYLLAVIIQHIPAGITSMADMRRGDTYVPPDSESN